MADKFSSAEDALFGRPAVPAAGPAGQTTAPSAQPSQGRILRDLHEPPPPSPELPPPARRGRKPGSKNKPKPQMTPAMLPARGGERPARAITSAGDGTRPEAPAAVPRPATAPVALAATELPAGTRRSRLRDRSTILKRYVLGTEPSPGQFGWTRGRRLGRSI